MEKREKLKSRFRRKSKLFAGAVALISAASVSLTPITASAALLTSDPITTLSSTLNTTTQTLTSQTQLTTGGTNLLSGATGTLTDVGTAVGSTVGGVVGGVTGTVDATVQQAGEILTNPTTLPDKLSNPATTVGTITDPLLGGLTGNLQGTNQTTVPGTDPITKTVETVTDTINNTTKTVTDILQNPANVGETIKDAIPGAGAGDQKDSSGLLNANIMTNEALGARLQEQSSGKYKLFLEYSGVPTLAVTLLSKTYVYFEMPEEFKSLMASKDFKKAIKATYSVPILGSPGPSAMNSGAFADSAIKINTDTNTIMLTYSGQISLALQSASKFSLEINLDSLPASSDKVYTFYSTAYDKNAIKVDLLEDKGARADVDVPNKGKESNNDNTNPGNSSGNNGGSNGSSSNGGSGSGSGTGADSKSTGSSSSSGWLGGLLPNTSTNIWNIGLIGLVLFIAGAAIKFHKMRGLV
ncbi:hypothetical protein [Neobacillus sp. SAB-20_R2A]|uniref:hypothetical protein n=1 Tax=Neobacillus sp. SAB-20_R2A TaxID=3120519 RepID=UPI003C6E1E43